MIIRLVLLFAIVPLAELYLLIQLGRVFDGVIDGAIVVIVLVLATGVLGATLARRQGVAVWRRIQRDLADGILPADGIIDGLMVVLAAALLITPGLLTDALGFAMLIPPIRRLFRNRVKAIFRRKLESGTIHITTSWHDDTRF